MLLKLTTNILLCVLLVIFPTAPATNHLEDPPQRVYLPLVGRNFYIGDPSLLISALYYDTYITGEPDEAFQVYNPFLAPVALTGWKVTVGTRTVTFPAGMTLSGNARLWCARKAADFRRTFGMSPGCEYGGDTDPAVPELTGAALTLTNTGGRVTLGSPTGSYADVLVYEAGDASAPGWLGPAVDPYKRSTSFGEEGQILYRKLDQRTGLPVPDTDTRADWAQDPDDLINGRKAQYPGWELDRFFVPRVVTESATLKVFMAPDNSFAAMKTLLEGATSSIRFEGYTFENVRLGELIAARGPRRGRGGDLVGRLTAGGCHRSTVVGRAANRAGRRTHLLSPVQLNRRHSRPLHLSAWQVLGAGSRHGADRQREYQRRSIPRRRQGRWHLAAVAASIWRPMRHPWWRS